VEDADEKRALVERFCFSDDEQDVALFRSRRRFFVYPPPVREMLETLRADGVLVVWT
jgi:hypothetical protein